jgi:phosphoglycerate kinase
MSTAPASALAGKTVLFRADLADGVTPTIAKAIAALAEAGARVAVVSGYGAPEGDINPTLSLGRFVEPLAEATGKTVSFVPDCIGTKAEAGLDKVEFGAVALMENVRFHPDAYRHSRNFAMRLSVLGDYFAIGGDLPANPVGWIVELSQILPAAPAID